MTFGQFGSVDGRQIELYYRRQCKPFYHQTQNERKQFKAIVVTNASSLRYRIFNHFKSDRMIFSAGTRTRWMATKLEDFVIKSGSELLHSNMYHRIEVHGKGIHFGNMAQYILSLKAIAFNSGTRPAWVFHESLGCSHGACGISHISKWILKSAGVRCVTNTIACAKCIWIYCAPCAMCMYASASTVYTNEHWTCLRGGECTRHFSHSSRLIFCLAQKLIEQI